MTARRVGIPVRRVAPVVLCCCVAVDANAAYDCTVSATPVAFGTYDQLLATADDSTGTVTVTCDNSPPGKADITYLLKLGSGLAGAFAPRQLGAGTGRLNYYLYTDAAHSLIWGDGTAGTSVAGGTFSLNGNQSRSRNHTVYGRIPALQDPAAGNYTDTIVVTLEF